MRAWLAIFALLVQVIVPGYVIAGHHAPPQLVDLRSVQHPYPGEAGPQHKPDSADRHGPHCPLCLVHKVSALLPPGPTVGPRLAHEQPTALALGTGIVPACHFLTCVLCRAPPRASKPA